PRPGQFEAEFKAVIASAMGKSVGDVRLRLWTPVGAQVNFVNLAYPQKVDLTARARTDPANAQVRDYPTGSWGEERRDYHLSVTVNPGKVGQRMLAGRVSLVTSDGGKETKLAEGMILAV